MPHDMPSSPDAERAVVGALLMSPDAALEVADWLHADDFHSDDMRAAYATIRAMLDAGESIDALTVTERLEADGARIGATLFDLASNAFTANVRAYGEIVREAAQLRRVIVLGRDMQAKARAKGVTSEQALAEASQRVADLQSTRAIGGLAHVKAALREWYGELVQRVQSGGRVNGLATPWSEVNELTLGLQPGDMVLLAGRPGMGKSVAGFQLSGFAALRGVRTALFSLEMTRAQVMQRMVSCFGSIPHDWLRGPDSEAYWAHTTAAIEALAKAPLLIDDTPSLTWSQIASRTKRAALQGKLGLVVVDHAHIVRLPGKDTVRELGDVSRGAKALAKELGCPVVLLAQLNRGAATRQDKRPTMADLRASGEMEQDADWIFLLHREDYYQQSSPRAGIVDLIAAKTRNAPTRDIVLRNRMDQMRLEDCEGAPPDADRMPVWEAGMD